MSRPPRSERLAAKGRPQRRAAKTHFFKYQLAGNPSRAEENDLKRALQQSLEEQNKPVKESGREIVNVKKGNNNIISSTNSSDVSRSNNSSSSNESDRLITSATTTNLKRTRSGTSFQTKNSTPVIKRAKWDVTNGHQNKCDGDHRIALSQPPSPPIERLNDFLESLETEITTQSRAIKTYSRSQLNLSDHNMTLQQKQSNGIGPKTSTPVKRLTSENPTSNSKEIARESSSVSRSTQTMSVTSNGNSTNINSPTKSSDDNLNSRSIETVKLDSGPQNDKVSARSPVQDHQYLKFKRESKNYAYVKMTALKVSTSKSPSGSSYSKSPKTKSSPNGISHNNSSTSKATSSKAHHDGNLNDVANSSSIKQNDSNNSKSCSSMIKTGPGQDSKSSGKKSPNISSKSAHANGKSPDDSSKTPSKNSKHVQDPQASDKINIPKQDHQTSNQGTNNDLSLNDTLDLSQKKNQNQANVRVTKKRLPQGSWSLLGVPEEKVIYMRDDEPPKRLICYPAIKHVEGDVIQVRDSVLLRSGARKTDLPYIAKVCAFWEDAETGNVMMSLFWYYRPEHTEEGRKSHHLLDEVFASRHRDIDSVECIEEKCYVLTFNEYCRYRKRCKMEQVNTTWSLTDVTIPLSNESYPRRNRIPDSDVNPELVFCCRQIYDSRMKRLVKNPLINPKYGHI